MVLYRNNAQVLSVQLRDGVTGAPINSDNSVTATLLNLDGTSAGATEINALSLGYVAASLGFYQETVVQSFAPAAGTYLLKVLNSTGLQVLYPVKVADRTSGT